MDEQQQIIADVAWYHAPLFFELSAVDGLVLTVIGICWSGSVWLVFEWVKKLLRLAKPWPHWLVWAPIVYSSLATVPLLPVALVGVGQQVEPSPSMAATSMLVGAVGGIGAKVGHDLARGLLEAVFGRLISIIGVQ